MSGRAPQLRTTAAALHERETSDRDLHLPITDPRQLTGHYPFELAVLDSVLGIAGAEAQTVDQQVCLLCLLLHLDMS